ncbi:hypothetical protein L916_19650 [Phytophthora nicotianae]|uniref:Uncharacterized protein n=2 Tax=Phytophthora nicotianae TaxID=4792 RepID=W2HZR1_PHYNI|nr:hypothetical protein L916_19650 [Phytophthora nicotianae]
MYTCFSLRYAPMLSRLEDVEQQLWTAATAIKLHLRLLKGDREAIGWAEIAALALVCGRIEQVQSELRNSTTEILSLARKSLAGGGGREEENERECEDGDTETEDEAEEMESVNVETRGGDSVDETFERLHTDAEDMLIGEEQREEERYKEVEVKMEHSDVPSRLDEDAESDVKAERTEHQNTIEEDDDRQKNDAENVENEEVTLCEEENMIESGVKMEQLRQSTDAIDARNESVLSSCEQTKPIHKLTDEANESVEEQIADKRSGNEQKEAHECAAEAKGVECGAEVAISGEKTEIQEDIPAQHHTEAVQEEYKVEENEAPATSVAASQFIEAHTSVDTDNANCHPDEDTNSDAKSQEPLAKADAKASTSGSSSCVDEAKAAVGMETTRAVATLPIATDAGERERTTCVQARMAKLKVCEQFVKWINAAKIRRVLQTGTASVKTVKSLEATVTRVASIATSSNSNLSSRLWIERMVAGLTHIFKITTKPELIQALIPVRKICSQLQQYCTANFLDYLQDLQNDLRRIEYLQQKGELDSSGLITSVRFLLDQLRQDCTNYSTQHTVDGCISRTEKQWKTLALVCDQIATWMKQIPPNQEKLPVDYLTLSLQSLGAFEARFPNRIPVKLLENIISMAQKTKTNISNTNVENEANTPISSDVIPNTKKRPRTDSNSIEPEFKRPAARDPFGPVKFIVAKFVEAASKVKVLVSNGNEAINSTQQMGTALGAMKLAATSAISGVTELLEHPDYQDDDIVTRFSTGMEIMASILSSIPAQDFKFVWLEHTMNDLMYILNLDSSKGLKVQYKSLGSSFSEVESYLEDNFFEWEREPVSTLDVMENRVQRFRNRKLKNMMSPIQSISGGLLIDISYFTAQNVDKKVLRTQENWSRFTAVGKVLAVWMFRALKSKARLPLNFFKRLLEQLQEFDAKFPDRLSPYLLRNTKALATWRPNLQGTQNRHVHVEVETINT